MKSLTLVLILIGSFLFADCMDKFYMTGSIQRLNQKACGVWIMKVSHKKYVPSSVIIDTGTVCQYAGGANTPALVTPCENLTIGMPVSVTYVPGDDYMRARAQEVNILLQ